MNMVSLLSHDLDTDPRDDRELDALLAAGERVRAASFKFPHLRRRYRVGRATLRCALGARTGRPPSSLALETGPQGKPALRNGPVFNASHAAGRLLLAIAPEGRLGVDIELLHRVDDLEAISRQNFAEDEREAVLATPLAERDRAFLEIWTRKEALIKAIGGGLSIPLRSFSVSLVTRPGSLLHRLDLPGETPAQWCLRAVADVPGAPEAAAALAFDVPDWQIEWLPPSAAFSQA